MDIVPATTDPDISTWTRTQPLAASMAPVPAGTFEVPKPAEAEPAPPPEAPKPEKPVTETGPDLDAALAKRKEETAATIRGLEENLLAQRGLMRPIAPPPLPRLQDVPKPPDYQLRSGFEAFQNPLTWLAIGGSLLTRRPAVAAMAAAAGAMEGFHQGDNERVKLEQKKFQDQMQAAVEQNNKELAFYNAAMTNKRFSAAERSAAIEAFAHQNQDLVAIDALKSGNYQRLFDVFKLRETLKEKAYEAEVRYKTAWERGAGRPGRSPEDVKKIVEGIRSGRQPPTLTGLYGMSPAVRAGLEEEGTDLSTLQLEWQQAQRQVASLSGPQMTRFFGLAGGVDRTITEVNRLAREMKQGGITPLNKANLAYLSTVKGNTPEGKLAAQYLAAVNNLVSEFAGLEQGGYAPTLPAWELAKQQIRGDYGVDQLGASLEEIQKLIGYRVNAVRALGGKVQPGNNPYLGTGGTAAPAAAPEGDFGGWH